MNSSAKLNRYRSILVALVALLVAAACGAQGDQEASPSPQTDDGTNTEAAGPEVANIELGTPVGATVSTPFIVAQEFGYFEQEGLEVELQFFPTGFDAATALVSGDVPISTAFEGPILNLIAQGSDLKAVSSITNEGPAIGLAVRPEIETPSDLEGRTVAVLAGTSSELMLRSFAEEYGVDLSSVDVQNLSPGDQAAAYEQGDVDAVAIWQPVLGQVLDSGAKLLHSGDVSYLSGQPESAVIFDDYGFLISSSQFIDENPNTIRAVLRALERAMVDVADKSRVSEYATLVNEAVDTPVELAESAIRDTVFLLRVDDKAWNSTANTQDFLIANGRYEEELSPSDVFNLDLLRQVDPEYAALEM